MMVIVFAFVIAQVTQRGQGSLRQWSRVVCAMYEKKKPSV
jgi:hypothetical protein